MAGVAPHPRDIGDRDVLFRAHIRHADGVVSMWPISCDNRMYIDHHQRVIDSLNGNAQAVAQASGGVVIRTTWQIAPAVAAPRPEAAV
jgi:hypothetical protein